MKTVREWYADIPGAVGEQLRRNMTDGDYVCDSLVGAVIYGFNWHKCHEGHEYWHGVCAALIMVRAQFKTTDFGKLYGSVRMFG